MLTLDDGRKELWQCDTGRKILVDKECSQVHFSNKVFGRSVDVNVVDGIAKIPDVLLQTDKDLMVWAFVGTIENGYTKISKVFVVNKRNKPADYVFTPTDQTSIKELNNRIEKLEANQDPEAVGNAVKEYLENNPIKEEDPTVPQWAKEKEKPTYTADEVGALPKTTKIPSKTSELENDSEFAKQTDVDKLSEEKVDKTKISLGKHSDGKIYIFVDGKPVGTGVEMGSAEIYNITNYLQEAVNSNDATMIAKGSEYTALIGANEGFVLSNVTITMGGEDITETVYNDGTIIIPEVTGDIFITVETSAEVVPTDIMSSFNYLGATTYSPGTYTAWCPTGLIYDETRDKYAHFMNVRGTHYSTPDQNQLWFNTIDPITLEHSEPVFVGNGATSVKTGGHYLGNCIKDGVYYAFSVDYGYYTSNDGGATWVHHEYETKPAGVWGCYVLSNGRMIMGSDAGATVNYCSISDDNGKNWTKVEANAIDTSYGAFDEPTFVEFGNGTVMAIIRKEVAPSDPMARPYMRVSNDYGNTWTDAVEMQTVGFMNANNCNAFVHDNYVELFVGCRIPTTNSDYAGTLYAINQYVLDRNKGAIDDFEFVNTVYEYKPDTGLEDFGVVETSTDHFSTPCIAIKDKSHSLMMFYAPTRVAVTHHLIAVGNIPVDNYSIPSIIPTSYNASQTFTGTSGETLNICESYGVGTQDNYPTVNNGYLLLDDIIDGGFVHIGRLSQGFEDANGHTWTLLALANVIDGKLKSFSRKVGIGLSPMPDNTTTISIRDATTMGTQLPNDGSILHSYAFIKNEEWWIHENGTWVRSDSGDCDISNLTYSSFGNSFELAPNNLESRTTYKAVSGGGNSNYRRLAIIEYDKTTA